MVRKRQLPGVDEAALAELAKQFPGHQPPAETTTGKPEASEEASDIDREATEDAAAPTEDIAAHHDDSDVESVPSGAEPALEQDGDTSQPEPAPLSKPEPAEKTAPLAEAEMESDAPPPAPALSQSGPKARGRGLAALALLVGLVALAVGLAALAPPSFRPWLQSTLGEGRVVDFLTGNRADFERRFADSTSTSQSTVSTLASHTSRLEAIEAVGGSNQAAARRVEAAESAAQSATAKIVALEAALDAALERLATQERSSAASTARLEALAADLPPRLDDVERLLRVLEKTVGGSERLLLIALRIREQTELAAPFAKAVAAARTIVPNGTPSIAALEKLAGYADKGVSTRQQLRNRFSRQVVPRLRAIERGAGRSWLAQATDWIDRLFSGSGSAATSSRGNTSVIVALAQRNLANGELATAAEQLAHLDGAAAAATASWLVAAKARLVVDEATANLTAAAFADFVGSD